MSTVSTPLHSLQREYVYQINNLAILIESILFLDGERVTLALGTLLEAFESVSVLGEHVLDHPRHPNAKRGMNT